MTIKYVRTLITIVLVGFSINAYACLRDFDCSPPGDSSSYKKIGTNFKITKYDENKSWISTPTASYLLYTVNIPSDIEMLSVSTKEQWFCIVGIPGFCGKILGVNGKVINNTSSYKWPKPSLPSNN